MDVTPAGVVWVEELCWVTFVGRHLECRLTGFLWPAL